MNDTVNNDQKHSFFNEFAQLLEGFGVLGLTYNLIAHASNAVIGLVAGEKATMAVPVLFSLNLSPSFVGDYLLVCMATGFVTYIALVLICNRKWVKEKVRVKECWKKKKWWNPFDWIWVLVCTFKEIIKWVLKWICKWKEVFVTVAVVVCMLAVAVAIAV